MRYSDGAPASMLQNLVSAGTPERVVEIINENLENERSTDDVSHIPASTDEVLEENTEPQFSNNALMDGIKFISDQVKCLDDRMIDHDFADIRMEMDKVENDIRKMKTTLETFCTTIAALENYLSTSAASHHSEVSQITSALVTAVQLKEAIEAKSGAPSVEHRIVAEMATSNNSLLQQWLRRNSRVRE